MKLFAVASTLVLLAVDAANAGTFTPPKGCTAFLTTQMRSCRVEHYWTCKGDAPGMRWIMVIGTEGPTYLQQVDNEFQWVQSESLRSGTKRRLNKGAPDPNSFTELLETNRDTYDFSQTVYPNGRPQYQVTVTGIDRLNGKQVSIDGEPLLVTEFSSHLRTSGGYESTTQGNQFISPKWRLFFGGQETETVDGKSQSYDDTPVLFIEPGEAGFLSDQPEYGCEAMMSGDLPDGNNG